VRPTDCHRKQPGTARRPTSCIEQLSEGWILVTDLCPVCTTTFMNALNAAVGQLRWHPDYQRRTEEQP
jgi:hypothetical protein